MWKLFCRLFFYFLEEGFDLYFRGFDFRDFEERGDSFSFLVCFFLVNDCKLFIEIFFIFF